MLTALIPALTVLHFAALLGLCLYGVHRLWLLRCLLFPQGSEPLPPAPYRDTDEVPTVTVQLPLYNERFVVEIGRAHV